MTQKDTIDIVAEATDLRRKLEEARIIAGYYRERMKDAESQMASMELTAGLKALEPLMTPKPQGWIATKDRLPEDGNSVVVGIRKVCYGDPANGICHEEVYVLKYCDDRSSWFGAITGDRRFPPDYWMPLPPLPEEGK